MKNKKKIFVIILIVAAIIMSLIFLYAGHFLLFKNKPEVTENTRQSKSLPTEQPAPVKYIHLSETIKGSKQEIFIIEADVSHPDIKILPVLSSDLIYGFENLSSMVARKHAFAGINGGFFTKFGLPSGMVAIDGVLATASKGKYPVFTVSRGKASLKEIKSKLWLKSKTDRLEIDNINKPALKGETVAYTPIYGSINRAKEENLTIKIKNGIITGIDYFKEESEIPKDGMLVSLFGSQYSQAGSLPFKTGDAVELLHEPRLAQDTQAYECGTWIVKEGSVVIGDKDEWVGVLTNQDPRTAVGIKDDGTVVFVVVDGRQPGYSKGMTGRELGEFLADYGVVNAAMLDGGASSEMIFNGTIVNKPSFKGQERPLAGGLLVIDNSAFTTK